MHFDRTYLKIKDLKRGYKYVLFAIFFIAIIPFAIFIFSPKPLAHTQGDNDCKITTENRTVRGDSLKGLINNGANVKILFGFYSCNEVRRNDIVAYNFSGNQNPIIKIAKALPGDAFHLEKNNNGEWNILINGKVLNNSQNQPYVMDDQSRKMLSLYENSYKGIIPQNTYLILGNTPSGSTDSTRFGLIGKNDILGKVSY